MTTTPELSFIIPIFNEEASLPHLRARLSALFETLELDVEVILVNDGSRDNSYDLLCQCNREDPRFKVVHLSRNFGHQTAITAGMDLASGRAIVVMDADLQDPPEVVPEMIAKWREGYQVVYAKRRIRAGESWFKRATAALFYRALRRMTRLEIPTDTGDFRLVDRTALEAFKSLRERNRFVRGLFSWVGFRQTAVEYDRQPRVAGETKYPLRKMLQLATDAVVSFSDVPLRLSLGLGFLVAAIAFLTGIVSVAVKLLGVYTVSGWTSLMVVLSFFAGVQLMVLGTMGLYIARINDEVKGRPLYIVQELRGFQQVSTPNETFIAPPGRPRGQQ